MIHTTDIILQPRNITFCKHDANSERSALVNWKEEKSINEKLLRKIGQAERKLFLIKSFANNSKMECTYNVISDI